MKACGLRVHSSTTAPGPAVWALCFWLAPLSLWAQTAGSVGSTAFPILSVGLGARAVGMGESFTAVADDLSAIHYNSAGLAQIQDPEVVLMHNSYLAGGFYDTVGCVYPFGTAGTLAFGLNYLNYGSVDQRDAQGNLLGTYTPFDISAGGAFGFQMDKNAFLGLSSQWMRQDIKGSVHTGLLWDAAFLAKPFERFSLGLNFKNLGVETGGYSLPAELMIGGAYRLSLDPRGLHNLLLAADGDLLFQSAGRLSAGFEYGFEKRYFLRAGYSHPLQDSQLGGADGLDFGAGLRFGGFGFDYSFSFVGDLGNIQRFALDLFFPSAEKPPASTAATQASSAGPPNFPPAFASPPGPARSPVLLKFQVTSREDLSAQQLLDRAEEKLRLGLKEEALGLYIQAVEKDPNFEVAWGRLGKLYFDKSLESYRKALELDPKNVHLREWLSHFKQQ